MANVQGVLTWDLAGELEKKNEHGWSPSGLFAPDTVANGHSCLVHEFTDGILSSETRQAISASELARWTATRARPGRS